MFSWRELTEIKWITVNIDAVFHAINSQLNHNLVFVMILVGPVGHFELSFLAQLNQLLRDEQH